MTRFLIAAAVLALPFGGPAVVQPTEPVPGFELPLALRELDRQTRVGASLAPSDAFCDHRDVVAASLAEDYLEEVVETAGIPGGRMLELWASEDAGTWTLVYHRADGVACVADYGEGWMPSAPPHPLMAATGLAV